MQIDFSNLSNEEIIKLAQEGNSFCVDFLLKKFKTQVNKIARAYFLVGGDFEDLVQEGMIGIYKAIVNFSSTLNQKFEHFVSVCIKNNILDAIKCASRGKHFALNNSILFSGLKENEVSSSQSPLNPESIAIENEQKNWLLDKSKEILNPSQMDILKLYLDGFSYNEISKELSLSNKIIDNTLQKVKKQLKRIV